jgi:transketolase
VTATGAPSDSVERLSAAARQIRQDTVRMSYHAGEGNLGGSLSAVDLLTALVFHELRIDPEHPDWPDRDRLVVSEGPATPALYSALAHRGFFDPAILTTMHEIGSPLSGVPDRRKLAVLEAFAGGAGQGIGIAVGMALDARLARRPSRVYAVVSDGECSAGLAWEALLTGGSYALDNLVVLIDRNDREADPRQSHRPTVEPLPDKLRAFGYEVRDADGHSFPEILGALAQARHAKGHPTAVIATTVAGKGVSFMEKQETWGDRPMTREDATRALAELGGSL